MPPFVQFLIRRLLAIPVTLLVITMLLYAGVMLTPPEVRAELYMQNTQRTQTEEQRQRTIDGIIKSHRLRDPFPIQYGLWAKSMFAGDGSGINFSGNKSYAGIHNTMCSVEQGEIAPARSSAGTF